MRYDDALAQARSGKALCVSNAGGRKRYAKFAEIGAVVEVTLFQTVIAVHHRDGSVVVNTGGYNTATTREALSIVTPYHFYSEGGVLKVAGDVVRDGMRLSATGVLEPGDRDVPLNIGVRGITRNATRTVCFGIDRDTGMVVSRLGNDFAWPVYDFAAMGPHDNFAVKLNLQLVPEREARAAWPAALGKHHVDPETRQQHQMFWLNARGGVKA